MLGKDEIREPWQTSSAPSQWAASGRHCSALPQTGRAARRQRRVWLASGHHHLRVLRAAPIGDLIPETLALTRNGSEVSKLLTTASS